ncbi:hypothetical protein A2Z22_03140 [Candidatus Woesebacteria bacterium RBG_16_34_12]|uniref:Dockerin domain-containing protein n=1 Tax=Candidatus Woesebacteria bacterium RBG_16_34_12 TaxID=1802480 RepID=A0A1F7XAM4_9BACT|nr:MAG: hypothetical protein A2Z22_03140 [Candidatus Woesebacteria bacterium RBG_16_34_12]
MKKQLFIFSTLILFVLSFFLFSKFTRKSLKLPVLNQEVYAQATSTDWPMLGHDLKRSSFSSQQLDPPFGSSSGNAVWVRDFAGGNEKTSELVLNEYQPVVVGDLLYVGTSRNNMYALNTDNGNIVWTYNAPQAGTIMTSPSYDNGVVYFASTNGHVYALNATTGALIWDREISSLGGFRTSPAVYNDSIYLGGEDGIFYAINKLNGSLRWNYDTQDPILNSAAIDTTRGRIYFANEAMYGYALDFSGNVVWQSNKFYGTSTRNFYPVIADGGDAVIFRTSPGPVSRALPGGDTLLARTAGHTVPDFTRIDVWGNMYGVDLNAPYNVTAFNSEQTAVRDWLTNDYPEYQTFYVLDTNNGSERYVSPVLWSGPSGNVGEPPVVAADGTVYVRTRTYYGNFDVGNSFYLFGSPATLNIDTGQTNLIRLPVDNNAHQTGIFMIGDEQSALSLGGNRLDIYNHADSIGSVLTTGLNAGPVTSSRDVAFSITKSQRDTVLPFGQNVFTSVMAMGASGNANQPAVIADGKIFAVSQGMIGMFQPNFSGQTNYIAASKGIQPVTGPITIPSTSVLESYVTQIEDYTVSSIPQDLQSELENQVADLITGEHYQPFIEMMGKMPGRIYFLDPTQEAYVLAISYPYLSTSLQAQVKTYLGSLWSGISDPLNYNYSYSSLVGRRRERYEINNDAGSYAVANGGNFSYTTPASERLYNLWAYAHYTNDWNFIINHWSSIVSAARSIDPAVIESGLPPHTSVNNRAASLIGYVRIVEHLRSAYPGNLVYASEYQWALSAATQALQTRLQWEENHRPTGTPWSQQWIRQDYAGYDVFMSTGWGRGGHIPRYNGLVPAIAKALRDFALSDMELQNDFIDTVVPAQILSWSFAPGLNEIFSNLLPQAREVFLAKALIMQEGADNLRDYLSYSWSKGDIYYIERLVHTIRASSPSGTLSSTPTPTLIPGDANSDETVDGIDYVIWLNHYNTNTGNGSTDGDFNTDGTVDGIDYVIWLNHYGS